VFVPERVVSEVAETSGYDDTSSEAAARVLDERGRFRVRAVDLDEPLLLDVGEDAAVRPAN
jgi:hypothetical protein